MKQAIGEALRALVRGPGVRRLRVAAGVAAIWSLILLFIPQFNLLNYYFSFAVALVVPLAAALVAARVPHDHPALGTRLRVVLATSLALLAIPLLLVTLGAFWIQNCDLFGGLWHYVLGPGAGVVFGAGLGLFAGTALPRRAATLVVLGVFVLLVTLNLRHFYLHPPISAYNHFAGFWTGAVYDDHVRVTAPWALFRTFSTGLGAALLGGAVLLERFRGPAGAALAAVVPIAVVVGFQLFGRFDLRREDIAAALGGRFETEHFVIHYATGGSVGRRIDALARDHEFRWSQLRDALDIAPIGKIRSFIYESDEQKQGLIGAGATFIAKPWTREMHLNAIDVGAMVLKHELAHVFGAELNHGWLNVPTSFGFFPRMGIVEGFAVALETARGRLGAHQWSAAMRAQGIAPPLADILRAEGFLGTHSGKAYTLAGSFLRFVLEKYGLDAFRELYRSGDFEDATGRPVETLTAEWEAFVDDRALVPLSRDDESLARFQFDQPSRFHRVCALESARWQEQAEEAAAEGKHERAVELLRKVLSFDPSDPDKRAGLADALVEAGRLPEARTIATELSADDQAGAVNRARARVRLADLEWLSGRPDEARALFRALTLEPLDEGTQRRVLVIDAIFTRPDALQKPLLGYLIGGEPSGKAALALLRTLAAELPNDPVVQYLYGRRAEAAGEREAAEAALGAALTAGLGVPILAYEAERLRARIAFDAGRYGEARERFASARALATAVGHREDMADWMARSQFMSSP